MENKQESYYDRSATATKEEDDSDYTPIRQGIINTSCNYDGSKIEDIMAG
ncbi:MAG: hypothetical protein H5T43_02085 [Methanomethylovorans sp.]|jgi:hypothetical protein|nr:hypothetical protein [Methanomethylovorans sp.]